MLVVSGGKHGTREKHALPASVIACARAAVPLPLVAQSSQVILPELTS